MRKPIHTLTLATLLALPLAEAEAWSFGTQNPSGHYGGYGTRGTGSARYGYSFGSGGFNACSQPYGGFYSQCLYGGSSYNPSADYPPPAYPSYTPGFYHGYQDGYYRGYYDGNRNRHGHSQFRHGKGR